MITTRNDSMGECPCCATRLNAAAPEDESDAVPTDGCATVCAHCGVFLVFENGLKLRELTIAEIAEMDDDSRNALIRARRLTEGFRAYLKASKE